jgi:hypothetical protein
VEKKKAALTSGTMLSVTRREGNRDSANWAINWARPKAERGERVARAGASGPRVRIGLPGRKLGREMKLLLFFLFKYFKAFSNDFESSFEFESNHSIQKFKCNSMSAQTCFYPYI